MTTYRFFCLKRQFCMISKYSAIESKELSFWGIIYISRIKKTMFLEYKIHFKNKVSKNISIICTVLVRTLYGAEK